MPLLLLPLNVALASRSGLRKGRLALVVLQVEIWGLPLHLLTLMDKFQIVDWNVTRGGHSNSRTSIVKNWVVDMVVPGGQIVVDIVPGGQIVVDIVVGNMVLGGQIVVDIDLDTSAVLARVLRSLDSWVYAPRSVSDLDHEIDCVVLDHAAIRISHFLFSRLYDDSEGHSNVCCVLSIQFVLCHDCCRSL